MDQADGTVEKQSQKKSNDMYNGYIERIRGGVLLGWAAHESNDSPVPIKVMAGTKEIGQGIADVEREDLKKAGIHQGKHGFRIELTDEIELQDSFEIVLVHAETHAPVKHSKFFYNKPPYTMTGYIDGFRDGHIVTRIASTEALGQLDVTLFAGNTELKKVKLNTNDKSADVYFPLPASLQDGKRRLYSLIAEGYPFKLAFAMLEMALVKTPWQYLKESFDKPNFISLPEQADHRYESLTLQLRELNSGKSNLTLENLTNIHSLLVEGFQDRKSFPKFDLPKVSKPRVSIIVPAYNKFELSYHCIASIALAFNNTAYEVILADDCSTDETTNAENIIGNLVVSRNPENLRFLRSCNRASQVAKGEFIVFLNNDTEVTSYWLDELIHKMDESELVGMTGSKLLNEDGSLQEAGGIVWKDGRPWNVGRNANPIAPEYNYAREVDYLTGAAMCIRKTIWEEVGRFSEEFVPCYYEDTDLAFKVRRAGYKTIYVPHSTVVHFEGQSHGTDVTTGLKKYQTVNEQTFKSKWFNEYRHGTYANTKYLATEKDRNIEQRVLVIDYAVPTPNKDAGGYAAVQEIKLMQALGFKVTFVPENLAHLGRYTQDLQRMGVEVLHAPFYSSVPDVLNKRLQEMDVVYITRYNVAEKYIDLIKSKSNVKIIFNNADLHFLRQLRSALKLERSQNLIEEALKTREKELKVCESVDAILCYNKTEHAVITSHILELEKLHITPWVLEEKDTGPEFGERAGIAFLGGFSHHPNVEAVEFLVSKVMPILLDERPDIKLFVYGSKMPDKFISYESENVSMKGFVETLDDAFHSHRVFVAPLLSGAGIKGKVLESMAYGTPTVLTDIAAEGTGLTNGINTFIADDPIKWVDSIIRLYDDEALWHRYAENSVLLARENFSFNNGVRRFKNIFESVGIFSSVECK